VSNQYLSIVFRDVPFYVDDVRIIPIDANHCPGALMFLFQFLDGKQILHTGDFRANSDMINELLCHTKSFDLIYLDTTYLSSKRKLPPQESSIQFVIDSTKKYVDDNIGEKFIIIVGTYLIGKEKIWMRLAEEFNFKVFLDSERYRAFEILCTTDRAYYSFLLKSITTCEADARIRVVNMKQISYPVSKFED